MLDINNSEHIAVARLDELREKSRDAMQALPEPVQDVYRGARSAAIRRDEKFRVTELIEEFTAPFCGHFCRLHYEAAFQPKWYESYPELYQARWWINEFRGACYFIYDSHDELQYVGSACTGALGKRIWHTNHREYSTSIDVVLFDRHWWHYSLAFEILMISRLKPPGNRQFVDSWVDPMPPWDQMWNKPGS